MVKSPPEADSPWAEKVKNQKLQVGHKIQND